MRNEWLIYLLVIAVEADITHIDQEKAVVIFSKIKKRRYPLTA